MPPSSEVVHETRHYFDIERDKTYPCFCEACLLVKTEVEISERDKRYCLECQVFIEADYKLCGRKYTPVVVNIESNLDPSSH